MKLWEVDSGVCVQEYSGHGDVVRDIKVVSHQIFISAANDRLSLTTVAFCPFREVSLKPQSVSFLIVSFIGGST